MWLALLSVRVLSRTNEGTVPRDFVPMQPAVFSCRGASNELNIRCAAADSTVWLSGGRCLKFLDQCVVPSTLQHVIAASAASAACMHTSLHLVTLTNRISTARIHAEFACLRSSSAGGAGGAPPNFLETRGQKMDANTSKIEISHVSHCCTILPVSSLRV